MNEHEMNPNELAAAESALPVNSDPSSPVDIPQESKPVELAPPDQNPQPSLIDKIKQEQFELEQELQDALGGDSLLDMYGMTNAIETNTNASIDPNQSSQMVAPGVLKGTVVSVASDGYFIGGLGGKSEGFLPKDDLEPDEILEIGHPVNVVIVRYDKRDGILILSRNAAMKEIMKRNLKEGVMVEVRVTGTNKGGLEVEIKGGLKAFMPVSQIDILRIEDTDPYVNQKFVCEVMQVDKGDKNIVVSRRRVLEKEQAQKGEELWNALEKGQIRTGRVRSIMDFGAFVDLGGADGLLHVSEMSWARIDKPGDLLHIGQEVEVAIKEIDKVKQRISLSMKMASANPWTLAPQKYPIKSRHQAKVVKLMNFGAFAELEPGIEGLIPVSEMSWAGRVNHPKDVVGEGQLVEVEILKLDPEKKQISMSIKSVQGDPWKGIDEKYFKDGIYTGTVARLAEFGAFITLEPGVDGLVHISEMSDKHVKRSGDVVKEGESVQVKVLEIDPRAKRISLSMKALLVPETTETAPKENPFPESSSSDATPKRKKKKLRGGLSMGGGFESLYDKIL